MSRPIPIEEMVRVFKSRHRTSHLFKIDNFSLFKKYQLEKVNSSVFDLGGHKWTLRVFPNGRKNASGHYVSIFLMSQSSVNVKIEYELFVVSQLEQKWESSGHREFGIHPKPTGKGNPKLISLVDLERNGYLIGDSCMCGVKLHGIEPAESGTAECFSLIEKPLNHKVTWMMTRFSSFEPEKAHHSHQFVENSSEGFINNASKTETYAKFKLRVLDQVNRNHVEKTCSGWLETSKGFADFMCLTKLVEPYLVNDKLYVGVDFEVVSVATYC
ncbi:hypothetical protein IGI04_032951 [Brassica rapa subsp. trilocularis]|uniref:MATH domain-containing protein n=1 Tax=Brassica rapa subsp. trilocularis TaxID=1813537 RepID=A0ABQ7L4F4_BRACM|nr:hypothetical protein IGI04_032951 [Brassica rapa subsp. trilocularis]